MRSFQAVDVAGVPVLRRAVEVVRAVDVQPWALRSFPAPLFRPAVRSPAYSGSGFTVFSHPAGEEGEGRNSTGLIQAVGDILNVALNPMALPGCNCGVRCGIQ